MFKQEVWSTGAGGLTSLGMLTFRIERTKASLEKKPPWELCNVARLGLLKMCSEDCWWEPGVG